MSLNPVVRGSLLEDHREMDEKRQVLAGVVSYVERVRDGRPWADRVEVVGEEPVEAITTHLRGWMVSTPPELARELISRGAREVRHAHTMTCDLGKVAFDEVSPPEGLKIVPCDRSPEQIQPACTAAYPPGHTDHHVQEDEAAALKELCLLVRGDLCGPMLACSALAVNAADTVVAGVIVNDNYGRPWITQVFRHPEESPAGLGALLLRIVQAHAARDGIAELGLTVTEGNPARRIYERLGFVVTSTSVTVLV